MTIIHSIHRQKSYNAVTDYSMAVTGCQGKTSGTPNIFHPKTYEFLFDSVELKEISENPLLRNRYI